MLAQVLRSAVGILLLRLAFEFFLQKKLKRERGIR